MRQLIKFIAMVLECLPELDSEVMQSWIENPKALRKVLAEALSPIARLEIWKTIKLGTSHKTANGFRQSITGIGGQVSSWASSIMDTPDFAQSVSQSPMELDLCVATTEEILGENGKSGTLSEIYAGIIRMGGNLLPAEAGPQLRLQYNDQPNGECLLMAMEPIKDSDGDLDVFDVRRGDGDFWLDAGSDGHGLVWPSDGRWVFSRPRC